MKMKPCKTCGVKPVLEHWASGGPMYAVRCNNPDRPNACDRAFNYSKSRNPDEAVRKWNEYQVKHENEEGKT